MGTVRLAQPADQVQQLEGALDTTQVTGWDVLFAVVVLALAYPVGRAAAGVTTGAAKRIPNMPEDLVKGDDPDPAEDSEAPS